MTAIARDAAATVPSLRTLGTAATQALPGNTTIPRAIVLNVKDYGAVGDGTTDDTTAVQAAVSAVPVGGGVVFFPQGVYLVSSTITVSNPSTVFEGVGWDQATLTAGSIIKCAGTTPLGATVSLTDMVSVASAATTFRAYRMAFLGNSHAINILTLNSLNCQVDECYFHRPKPNVSGSLLNVQGQSAWVVNCRMNGQPTSGSTDVVGIRINATDAQIFGNKPANCAVGIELQNGASGALLSGNHITPGSTFGVNCIYVSSACSNIGIVGNRIDNHGLGSGIQITPSVNCYAINISGNVFYSIVQTDATFAAIGVDTSAAMVYELSIVANTIRGAVGNMYASLLTAQKRDGTAATNPTRINTYGTISTNNTVFASALYGASTTPMVSGSNTISTDGTTWSTPADSSNPALGGDLTGTAGAARIVGPAPTLQQTSRYSSVAGQQPRESMSFLSASGNIAITSGVGQAALIPVKSGDVISKVGFIVGSTGATFATGGHWWTALYTSDGTALIGQSADQGSAALTNGSSHLLSIGTAYTVPAGVDSLLGVAMINVGSGGGQVTPTLRGIALNTAQVDSTTGLFTGSRLYSATGGTALAGTATAPLTLTPTGNVAYLGAA